MKSKYKVGDWVKIKNSPDTEIFYEFPDNEEALREELSNLVFVVKQANIYSGETGFTNGYMLVPHPIFEQCFNCWDLGEDRAKFKGEEIQTYYFENELLPAVSEEEEINSADVL